MTSRESYLLLTDANTDRQVVVEACQALLDVLRPVTAVALVDAVGSWPNVPPEADLAEAWLRGHNRQRFPPVKGDGTMGILIDPADDEQWNALRVYGAWSIHVELFATAERGLGFATLHDCGTCIDADLTPDEVAELSTRLAGAVEIVTFAKAEERRRLAAQRQIEERRARRAARWQRLRSVVGHRSHR